MPRPLTLFTGQWADLPLATLARRVGAWGYDGLELACWGDHFDVNQALASATIARSATPSSPSTACAAGPSPTTSSDNASVTPSTTATAPSSATKSGVMASPKASASAPRPR